MLLAERPGAIVDEEDHRRLQPFGGVRGHDADLGAALVHLALDLGRRAFQRCEKRLETRHARLFLSQAEIQELVQDVAGLRPKACDQLASYAVASEHAGIEIEHRLESRLIGPLVELRRLSSSA